MQARNLDLKSGLTLRYTEPRMKASSCLPVLALLLLSCTGTKELSINTAPEGADITINGEYMGKTPLVTTIQQDKVLGIVARKEGYAINSATLTPTVSKLLSVIWTENDPKAKYIEEDSVNIPLMRLQSVSDYSASRLPAYTGGGGSTSSVLPEVPALRPMPKLD